MTLAERGVGTPTVSVGELIQGDRSPIDGDSDISLDEYVDEIVRSGFPGLRELEDIVRRAQLQGYVERVIDCDIADVSGRSHRDQHEVDAIIERDDGRVIAAEVKLSPTVDDHDVRHLRWLGERLGDDLLDAMVITTGRSAYRRPDGIEVVPAALLGP